MAKICPNCKTSNPNSAEFCQSCGQELGTTSSGTTSQSQSTGGVGGWWNKQSTGGKAAIGIVGLCCVGLILIIAISGMFSSDKTTSTTNTTTSTNTTTTQTPTEVTIAQLYANGVPKGTLVKVTGTVLESQGSAIRIRDSDYKDVLIMGTNLIAYEDQTVTVIGTFVGPTTYDTAIGGARTVPTIENAKIA